MKVVPIGFPGRLDMRCERREEIQMTPKISPTRKMELPCSETGKTIVWGKSRSSVLEQVKFEMSDVK